MDETTRQRLLEKNNKIINMVIERAKRDFPDDIAIIGLTGSFSTGDFHEKSDLDLVIINNTDRGWEISSCFILGDVGYDIYCTPWETRIKDEANLDSPMVSHLIDLQILYCAKPEYMDKFNAYRQKALDALSKPIGKECIERAKKWIDRAKQDYADALMYEDVGTVRYAAGGVLHNSVNALINLNNTYIKRGIKRFLEELKAQQYLPADFENTYMAVINAGTVLELRQASHELLKAVVSLYNQMYADFVQKPVPSYENLKGSYEELWCNYRNKVIASVNAGDKHYAFHSALGAQAFLDEMTEMFGTKKFDLMQYFDSENLIKLKDAFLRMMDEYLEEYNQVGLPVLKYDSFEELYDDYMKK